MTIDDPGAGWPQPPRPALSGALASVVERAAGVMTLTGSACGVFFGDDLFITCHHVLPTPAAARAAVVVHSCASVAGRSRCSLRPWRSLAAAHVHRNQSLDYVAARWPAEACVQVDALAQPQLGEDLIMVLPTMGRLPQRSLVAVSVTEIVGPYVFYRGATRYGMSGAPIFNAESQLVALHQRRTPSIAVGEPSVGRGVSLVAIGADLVAARVFAL